MLSKTKVVEIGKYTPQISSTFPVIRRPTYYFKEILTSMLLLLHENFYVKANEV